MEEVDQEQQLLIHLNPNSNDIDARFPVAGEIQGEIGRDTWDELKKIWEIAAPSIFCRLSMFSLTIITQSLAGHLSDLDLAAFSIATTLLISISFGFLIGMASALETLCGQAYGAKQHHMLGIYLQRSFMVLFFCSLLLLPLFTSAETLLKILGQSTEVAKRTGLVAKWLIPMHLSFVFQFSLLKFLQCQRKTAVIAWSAAIALLVHAIISWIFVYKLGVGVVGSALTLDFSWWISVFFLYGYVACGGCPMTWNGFSWLAFFGLFDFFKLSVATGIMFLLLFLLRSFSVNVLMHFPVVSVVIYVIRVLFRLEHVYYRVLVIASGDTGNSQVEVDALSICVTAFGWESMVPLGIFTATGVRVAIELGAGNVNGAKFAAKVCLVISLVIGLSFFSLTVAIPERLAMIFTPNLSVIHMVRKLSLWLGVSILINSIPPVILGIAVGSGWQTLGAYVNTASYYLVGFPVGIFLGWVLNFGYKGIWAGMLGGSVLQILLLTIIILGREWKNEVQTDDGKKK